MQAVRLLTSTLSIVALLCAGGSMALAQEARPWVDPPPDNGVAGQPAPPAHPSQPLTAPPAPPAPEAQQSARPSAEKAQPEPTTKAAEPKQQDKRRTSRADVAKSFAIDYLASWSSRNDVALDATAELYAPRVLFHGRTVSLERLYKEKQRFTRRWPEREYRPREDSIGTECNPAGTVCTVHAVFDYTATNPKRRRLSQGSGALQLIVEFIGEKPIIVAEHSTLLQQTRKRTLALEGTSNE
ncbi:hypothetical protein [Microvirga guangxiensis]|uniref:SnoaL-like domain-containing protein n=1 Tax=Microvirga guangxiensis TaxID=549386 RepID=A0A1G5GQN0_9HYPH|nr:hypothetical protein [Microvirga guangxiensis]SCY53500.1 hypothetical protein SAMN02927923_01594 [Microvirga guangxiensis]